MAEPRVRSAPGPQAVAALVRAALAGRLADPELVARLDDDTPVATLGIDSLALISLVADLQRSCDVPIDDDVVFQPDVTIAALVAAVAARPTRPSAPGLRVTGLGVVAPTGHGVGALWEGLLAEQAYRIPAPYPAGKAYQVGAVPGATAAELTASDRLMTLLTAAAEEALADAGVADRSAVRLVVGTTDTGGNALGEALTTGTPGACGLAGTLARRAASALGLHRDAVTIGSASASGAVALGFARDLLASGEAELVLVATADTVSETAFHGLAALRTLSESGCQPFNTRRRGIAVSEAAGAMLLRAVPDGPGADRTTSYGRLVGYGASSHTTHLAAPEAAGIALAVRRALDDANGTPADVAFVNTHGPGTPLGDVAEIDALREVFGDALPRTPLNSAKGTLWHCQGAAGLIESMVCLLSLRHDTLTPTTGSAPVDQRWADLDIVATARPLGRPGYALSVSCGLGGVNTALLWGRP